MRREEGGGPWRLLGSRECVAVHLKANISIKGALRERNVRAGGHKLERPPDKIGEDVCPAALVIRLSSGSAAV